jgi:hypothetical protein
VDVSRAPDQPLDAACTYAAFNDGHPTCLLENDWPTSALAEFVHGQFGALVPERRYSCVGGWSAMHRATCRFARYAELDMILMAQGYRCAHD